VSTREQLELSWKTLEQRGKTGPGSIRLLETGVSTRNGKVLVGIDGRGQRHLCLATDKSELGQKDSQSRGVFIEVLELIQDEKPVPYVDVQCRDSSLHPIFAVMVSDMLDAVGQAGNAPFSTCRTVLERWRRLLLKERSSLLSREELGGLFAELLVLERLTSIRPDALRGWKGPARDLHDFVCGSVDLEVKSTQSASAYSIEISDLLQLEPPPSGSLYLGFHRIHLAPGRGRSVPAVVDDLLELGASQTELFEKLSQYGYDLRDSEAYVDQTFELLEERWFEVGSTFPRLGRSSFKDGLPPVQVRKIRYTLDLAGVTGILTSEEVASVMKTAANLGGSVEPTT
jgi:hypothetical protein